MPLGMRGPLANARQAQYVLLRQRAYLQQIVHQTTHSLARFFLEVDANYKQFKTASRLRAAAAQRLEAQRAYYEEGRITIDRFLDAVSQYAQAVASGGPVQDHLQHLDRGSRGGEGDAAGVQQHRRGRRPVAAEGLRPGPRHPERHRSSRSRTTGRCTGSGSRARRIPTRSRTILRPTSSPATIRCCPPRSVRSARPTPLPPYRPAGEAPIISRTPVRPKKRTCNRPGS